MKGTTVLLHYGDAYCFDVDGVDCHFWWWLVMAGAWYVIPSWSSTRWPDPMQLHLLARFSVENDCLLWKAMSKTVVGSVLFRESVSGQLGRRTAVKTCWKKRSPWYPSIWTPGESCLWELSTLISEVCYQSPLWALNLVPGLPAPVWGKRPLCVVRRCFGCSPPLKTEGWHVVLPQNTVRHCYQSCMLATS